MALVTRLTRLFQADFHAVLDRIEEPELQLRQAVREMQFALEQDRQRGAFAARGKQLGKRRHTGRLKALDQELDICLAAKRTTLHATWCGASWRRKAAGMRGRRDDAAQATS